jgi:hypothetical protein
MNPQDSVSTAWEKIQLMINGVTGDNHFSRSICSVIHCHTVIQSRGFGAAAWHQWCGNWFRIP